MSTPVIWLWGFCPVMPIFMGGQTSGRVFVHTPLVKEINDNENCRVSFITHMTSFTYFPAVSDVNIILSKGLFSHVAAHMFLWRIEENYPLIILKYPPYCNDPMFSDR